MRLFDFFFQPLHFIVEVIEAADAEVVAYSAAVGRDSLIVGDAAKTEQLLQAVMMVFLFIVLFVFNGQSHGRIATPFACSVN